MGFLVKFFLVYIVIGFGYFSFYRVVVIGFILYVTRLGLCDERGYKLVKDVIFFGFLFIGFFILWDLDVK